MNEVIDGVIIPPEMKHATTENKKAYAAGVKGDNARFVKAALDLEDAIEKRYGPDEARRILNRG